MRRIGIGSSDCIGLNDRQYELSLVVKGIFLCLEVFFLRMELNVANAVI